MKKAGKFICAVLTVLLFAAIAYYFVKNIVNKDTIDDSYSYDDDFDAFVTNTKKDIITEDKKNMNKKTGIKRMRSYITLNMNTDAE